MQSKVTMAPIILKSSVGLYILSHVGESRSRFCLDMAHILVFLLTIQANCHGKLNDDRRLLAGDGNCEGDGDAIGDRYRCVSSTCRREVSCWICAFRKVRE